MEAEQVEVEDIPNPLCRTDFEQLQALVDPMEPSEDHGYAKYLDALRFVNSKLS